MTTATTSQPRQTMTAKQMTSTKRETKDKGNAVLLSSGFISGLCQAMVFNPWDRALYLAIKNKRKFLLWENFHNPMAGMFQTVFQRAISSGMYFPMEEIYQRYFREKLNKDGEEHNPITNLLSGVFAGSTIGLLMNPLSSVKYHYWGSFDCGKENFASTAQRMYSKGGIRPFFVGSTATIMRDVVFGGTYSALRHELIHSIHSRYPESKSKSVSFLVNMVSAVVATFLSSPFNYVRSRHYATPSDQRPLSAYHILTEVWSSARKQDAVAKQWTYLVGRFQLGWGTLRVGCGMAFSSQLYMFISNTFMMK